MTHNGNGISLNGKPWHYNAGKESLGFVVAEGTSMLAGLGVVAVMDQVLPDVVNGASKFVARTIVEPALDPIESLMRKICKLEECQADESQSRKQRADQLAKVLTVFTASAFTAFVAKLQARRFMNKALEIPNGNGHHSHHWIYHFVPNSRKEAAIMLADEGTHYGLAIWMNAFQGGAKWTDEKIRNTADFFHEKLHMSKEKAHEVAAYTYIWELPNLAGLMAGTSMIAMAHRFPQSFKIAPKIVPSNIPENMDLGRWRRHPSHEPVGTFTSALLDQPPSASPPTLGM